MSKRTPKEPKYLRDCETPMILVGPTGVGYELNRTTLLPTGRAVGGYRPTPVVPARPVEPAQADPEFADYGKPCEILTAFSSSVATWMPATIERTLNGGALYEVRADWWTVTGGGTIRIAADKVRFTAVNRAD